MLNILNTAANTDLINSILTPILAAVGTVLASVITYGITRLIKWINSKTNNLELQQAIETILNIIKAAVETTNQRYVDNLKKAGKFDIKAQKEAFKQTFDLTKELLTDEVREILEKQFGKIDTYISTLIEQIVATITH